MSGLRMSTSREVPMKAVCNASPNAAVHIVVELITSRSQQFKVFSSSSLLLFATSFWPRTGDVSPRSNNFCYFPFELTIENERFSR